MTRALDLSIKGSFLDLNVEHAVKEINNLCESQDYQTMRRSDEASTANTRDADHHTTIHARLDELSELVNNLLLKKNAPAQIVMCRTCGDTHHVGDVHVYRRSGNRTSQLCESHFYP